MPPPQTAQRPHSLGSSNTKVSKNWSPWSIPMQRDLTYWDIHRDRQLWDLLFSNTHLPINHRFHFLVQTPTKSLGNLHLGNHTHKHFRDLAVRDIHPQTQQRPHTHSGTHTLRQNSPYTLQHTPHKWTRVLTPPENITEKAQKHSNQENISTKTSETSYMGKYTHKHVRELTHWHMYPQRPES